jgi:hypothetical protein
MNWPSEPWRGPEAEQAMRVYTQFNAGIAESIRKSMKPGELSFPPTAIALEYIKELEKERVDFFRSMCEMDGFTKAIAHLVSRMCPDEDNLIFAAHLLYSLGIRQLKSINEPERAFRVLCAYMLTAGPCEEQALASMPYDDFLKTFYWKIVSDYVKKQNPSCVWCEQPATQAHHKHYKYRGKEWKHLSCLASACDRCHGQHHHGPDYGLNGRNGKH